jgi:hypothetical protein
VIVYGDIRGVILLARDGSGESLSDGDLPIAIWIHEPGAFDVRRRGMAPRCAPGIGRCYILILIKLTNS